MTLSYIGSGPYCYANSVTMALGAQAPNVSLVEVLTQAPFGIMLLNGDLPFFSPINWDPPTGSDTVLDALGWRCVKSFTADPKEAIERLRVSASKGPVVVGPVEIGLLLQHAGSGRAMGGDHYVVVYDVDDECVQFHDPHGFPHSSLPISTLVAAWTGELLDYGSETYSFASRYGFQQVESVVAEDALHAAIPAAIDYLSQPCDGTSLAGEAAVNRLADMVEEGLKTSQYGHLIYFAIRLGARRLADVGRWFRHMALLEVADIADKQTRLLGRLQYEVVVHNDQQAGQILRQLAPTYEDLRRALQQSVDRLLSLWDLWSQLNNLWLVRC